MKVPFSITALVASAIFVPHAFAAAEDTAGLRASNTAVKNGRKLAGGNMFGGGTPDGETPALENVCDQYPDQKAKGFCVAFCEAKDCDVFEHKSCDKLKANFQKITGESTLPCEARCPCWEVDALDAVTAANQLTVEQYGPYSCADGYTQLGFHVIQALPELGGGFAAAEGRCFTRGPALLLAVTPEEEEICVNQIVTRCAEIGSAYTP